MRENLKEHQSFLDQEQAEKNARKKAEKHRVAFEKLPEQTEYDFWCNNCELDFKAPAYRTWSNFYGIGSWVTFCPGCEQLCARHITDRATDPYYEISGKIRAMRSEFEEDMLQPGSYGFETLYGDPFKKHWMRANEMLEQNRNRYAAMGFQGRTLREKTEEEEIEEAFSV